MKGRLKIITGALAIAAALAGIEAEAAQLSGYISQDNAGYMDDDDAGNAGQDKKSGNTRLLDFKFKITNTGSSATDRTVAWYAPEGMTTSKLSTRGYTVDAVVTDGTIVGSSGANNDVVVTASRSTLPYDELIRFARVNALRLIGLTIRSNTTDAFNADWQVYNLNPIRKSEEQIIDLDNYYNENNLTGKKIEADLINDGYDINFDDQTLIIGKVIATVNMTITYRFGAVNNPAAKFDKKSQNARGNVHQKLIAMGSNRRFAGGMR